LKFNIKKISLAINARFEGNENVNFSSVSIDTRTITEGNDTLFVALTSNRNDGHKYLREAYLKGVRAFLISNREILHDSYPEAGFLVVKDTLKAFQELAKFKRKIFKIDVVGITGSNGKTVVKEWLSQLISPQENVCRSPKSYNSQIGVPLSVWNLSKKNTIGIFEAGISEPDEMHRLSDIIQPTKGIFTNLLFAHDENFSSRNQKAIEKLKLFHGCKKIYFCADHKNIVHAITEQKISKSRLCSWGKSGKNNNLLNVALIIVKIISKENLTTIWAQYRKKKLTLIVPFNDKASIENAIHCWLFLLESGYKNRVIQERFLNLSPVEMRLELKKGINGCSVINDSYSLDIGSLSIALDFLNRQTQHQKKTVIISDISESGKKINDLYVDISKLLSEKKINRLIGIGKDISSCKNLFHCEKIFYQTTEEFIKDFSSSHFLNEAILIKGARKFEFEKIGVFLQEKSHDTVLEINFSNMIHNLNYYRSIVKKEVKVMAMVKAFSYGSGSYETAALLQHHGVNYLAVAYADEGVELRKAGIELPIMVMNPEEQSFSDLIEYNLEPEIFSMRILDLFFNFLKEHRIKKHPGIHVKLDTGMHRLGFTESEINELINRLKKNSKIKILSIFSHLVGSDTAQLDYFTQKQINLFKKISLLIANEIGYKPLFHICNSSGISRFPHAHFDMVRLGIGLYGIGTENEEKNHLLNSVVWKTKISQIKFLKTGDSVGYNRSGSIKGNKVIATIPLGYADGFSRRLSNGIGSVYIKNKPVPIIGNVCMDMCMIDITEVYNQFKINEGEEVIIFNSTTSLHSFAKKSGTIPYEILTSVSQRVKRIYLTE
jgi:alanine racemase